MRANTLDGGCPRKRSQMLPKLMRHRDNCQSAPVGAASLPQALGGGQGVFSSMEPLRPRESRSLSHVAGIISSAHVRSYVRLILSHFLCCCCVVVN